MEFQTRELRKVVFFKSVLAGTSVRMAILALTLGIVIVVCAQLWASSQSVFSVVSIVLMTGFVSLSTWCFARRSTTTHDSTHQSTTSNTDNDRMQSIIRSGHARIRMVTSSVASQMNNSLMVMMSSLELAERNTSDFKQQREFLSIRRGIDDATKLAQRLVRMSVPKGNFSGLQNNIVTMIEEHLAEISADVHSSVRFNTKFESRNMLVAIPNDLIQSVVSRSIRMHSESNVDGSSVYVEVGKNSRLDLGREESDFITFEVSSSGKRELFVHDDFQAMCCKHPEIQYEVSIHNETRSLKLTFPAAMKYSSDVSDFTARVSGDYEVLLVEDDPQIRTLIGRMINPLEYSVQEAGNVEQGFSIIEGDGPAIELAIIDIKLPDGSGLVLAETIRIQFPEIPVLLITGGGFVEIGVDLQSDPRVSILQKPFRPSDLKIKIDQLLRFTDHVVANA
jgi:CheY-like chemotaxis protein